MEARNLCFAENGDVLMEINHPVYGWIPFGASPVDVEEHGRKLHAMAIAGEFGVIAPYVEPVVQEPTMEQRIERYKAAVQKYLDDSAKAKGYDDIVYACSYAGYENTFRAEGESFGVWRAAVWSYCYAELDKVVAGQRAIPTIEQILGELPTRVLP